MGPKKYMHLVVMELNLQCLKKKLVSASNSLLTVPRRLFCCVSLLPVSVSEFQ